MFSKAIKLGFLYASLVQVASSANDAFGIAKLYSSDPAKEGSDWLSKWSGPQRTIERAFDADPQDSQTVMRGRSSNGITIGSNECVLHPGIPRLYINQDGAGNGVGFGDVEITAYANWMRGGDETNNAGFTMIGRTDHFLTKDDGCHAAGYYMRIWEGSNKEGQVSFQKEYYHGSGGTVYSSGDYEDLFNSFPKNQWIGMKFVIFTIPNTEEVQLELYVDLTDGQNGGDWNLVHSFVDKPGAWGAKESFPSRCEIGDGDPILREGFSCALRTDGGEVHWKKASVRHITPGSTGPTDPPPPSNYCVNGILSNNVCCADSCGRCGGSGCSQLPGGATMCCTGSITNSGRTCQDANDVACLVPEGGGPVPTPPPPPPPPSNYCDSGFLAGDVCCAGSCGRCGGSGCSQLPGGATMCCTGSITNSGRTCQDTNDIACLVPEGGGPAPSPGLPPTNPTDGWTVITYDDFEAGWGNYISGGSDSDLYTDGDYAHQGSNAAEIQDDRDGSFFAHSSEHNVAGFNQLHVSFWFYAEGFDAGEDFWLQYSTDGGSHWITSEFWVNGVDFENDSFYQEDVFVNSSAVTSIKLRFICSASNNSDSVYIDEIQFEGKP